jgi:hypothetical protein
VPNALLQRLSPLILLLASCDDSDDERPPRDTGDVVVGEGLSCVLADTLEKNCWGCHGEIPSNGAPFALVSRTDLLTKTTQGATRAERSVARMRATSKPMPPTGARVPEQEIAILEAWMNAGSPAEMCTTTCLKCADLLENFVSCAPMDGTAPNVCNASGGQSYYICANQACATVCGIAAPGQPQPACPNQPDACRACLQTNCDDEKQVCDQ